MRTTQDNIIKAPSGKPVNFIPNQAYIVTPHDTEEFQYGLLYIGVGGDVRAIPQGLTTFVTFKGVPTGSFLPIYVKAVHTDTTATDMLICY